MKATAGPAVLADYVRRFRKLGSNFQRMFFVCHTPKGTLATSEADVAVWTGDRLAEQAVRAGLLDLVD